MGAGPMQGHVVKGKLPNLNHNLLCKMRDKYFNQLFRRVECLTDMLDRRSRIMQQIQQNSKSILRAYFDAFALK